MFDYNDPEVRSAISALAQEMGEEVSIIPLPAQNGEGVDSNYVFTASDVVGTIPASITEEAINQHIIDYRWRGIRSARDAMLLLTDIWALPDREMTQAQIDYRQALRDITSTHAAPDDVVWPTKPE